MATFKLLSKNDAQGWVEIQLTFDDGRTYTRKKVVDLTDLVRARQTIRDWYARFKASGGDAVFVPDPAIQTAITNGTVINA